LPIFSFHLLFLSPPFFRVVPLSGVLVFTSAYPPLPFRSPPSSGVPSFSHPTASTLRSFLFSTAPNYRLVFLFFSPVLCSFLLFFLSDPAIVPVCFPPPPAPYVLLNNNDSFPCRLVFCYRLSPPCNGGTPVNTSFPCT